ncbi:MAG: IPT/TIG domain-containing protein [Candidatus Kapaibacterium sp.]
MRTTGVQWKAQFVAIVLLGLLFAGCPDTNNPVTPVENKLELGTETQLNQTQQNAGSVVTINKPGNVLNGMTITIPTGAYTNARPFTVTSFEIKSHKFGTNVNPITPLIRVTSSGGYADGIYEVKIPITLPQGEIPLVFIYDEQTGKLEPMIVQYYNATSVTALTRHLATSVIHPQGAAKLIGSKVQGLEEYSSFFVSSLKESLLNAAGTITTGFAVGVDDWEFVNWGSYVAPGGHCAGQSIGAMWYWYEKKSKTGEKLFNKFSDNPNLWQDNARGYRFSSVLQKDLLPQSLFTGFMRNTVRLDTNLDKIKFLTTAGALYVTHEPLYISIAYQDGVDDDNKPKYAGHAIVCYGVSMNEKKILISDPNTPNNAQSIELINDHFKPYQSKLNGNAASSEFPFITPMAKTSLIDWSKIESRYTELLNGTIGNGIFPAYTLYNKSTPDAQLTDGFVSNSDTLRLYTDCPTAQWGWNVDGKRRILTTVFNTAGNTIQVNEGSGLYRVQLSAGENKLGVLVEGEKGTTKDVSFIDFKWITVYYKNYPFKIIPKNMKGDENKEYTWNITTDSIPKELKYYLKWNFGDGTSEQRTDNINYAKHTYTKSGTFTIRTTLFDATSHLQLSKDSANAEIIGAGSMYPTSGPNGQVIVITGSGFGNIQRDGDEVTLHHPNDVDNHNYRAIHSRYWSDTRIEAIINNSSWSSVYGNYKIKVRLYNSSTMSYTWLGSWDFNLVKCEITSISPDTVTKNTLMTINGKGFGVKMSGDTIRFGDSLVPQIQTWTDTKIECVVPDYYDGQHYVYLFKAAIDEVNRYDATTKPYWRSLPKDIFTLLQRASTMYIGYWSGIANCTYTGYDANGKPISTWVNDYNFTESLVPSVSPSNTLTKTGTGYIWSAPVPGDGSTITVSVTLASDGKTIQSGTYTRTNSYGKVIMKISVSNVPLANYYKVSSDFAWNYESPTDASGVITDFYVATYSAEGKLQSDWKLKTGKKLFVRTTFKY